MNISDFLRPENVMLGLAATSKLRLLHAMSEAAEAATGIDKRTILSALRNREELGSTGIGGGIAIPHAPITGLAAPFAMLVRLDTPIDFEAIDDLPVDIVFLLLTPTEGKVANLNALSCVTRQLRRPAVLSEIRLSPDGDHLYSALVADA